MIFQHIRRLALKHPRLLPTVFAVALILSALFMQVERGSSDPEVANPTGPTMDATTLQANTAKTDAAEAAEEQAYRDALNQPQPPKDSAYVPSPNQPLEPIPTGILQEFSLLPGWASQYHIANAWQQFTNSNGDRVKVYAGSVADDAINGQWDTVEQGALVLLEFPSNPNAIWGASTVYTTPTRTGQVSVTSYNGMCLTLASTGGSTYQFDVATRQWSCSVNQQPSP